MGWIAARLIWGALKDSAQLLTYDTTLLFHHIPSSPSLCTNQFSWPTTYLLTFTQHYVQQWVCILKFELQFKKAIFSSVIVKKKRHKDFPVACLRKRGFRPAMLDEDWGYTQAADHECEGTALGEAEVWMWAWKLSDQHVLLCGLWRKQLRPQTARALPLTDWNFKVSTKLIPPQRTHNRVSVTAPAELWLLRQPPPRHLTWHKRMQQGWVWPAHEEDQMLTQYLLHHQKPHHWRDKELNKKTPNIDPNDTHQIRH